jgi:hypothetical protein
MPEMSTCVLVILFDVDAAKPAIRAGRPIAGMFAVIAIQSQYRAPAFMQVIPEGAGTVKATAGCFFACLRAS